MTKARDNKKRHMKAPIKIRKKQGVWVLCDGKRRMTVADANRLIDEDREERVDSLPTGEVDDERARHDSSRSQGIAQHVDKRGADVQVVAVTMQA